MRSKRTPTTDANLDGPTTSFTVPDGFLENHRDYAVEVKAVAPNGNQTATDSTLSTG